MTRNKDGSLKVIGKLPENDGWLRGDTAFKSARYDKEQELGRPLTPAEEDELRSTLSDFD